MAQEFTRGGKSSIAQQHTEAGGQFVINLCNLEAPITVPQPQSARLSRYSFFLSHRWESGRRLYRLHMGYFRDPQEADKWLQMLKRVYPEAHVARAPESQPDLMSNTQRLRVLDIGALGGDPTSVRAIGTEPVRGTTASPKPAATSKRSIVETAPRSGAAAQGSPKVTKPDVKPAPASDRSAGRSEPTIEDTLNDLRTSEFDMGDGDDLNATGVRHLRFEVEKAKRADRRSLTRNRK